MKNLLIKTAIALLLFSGMIFAQDDDYSKYPGYVDFGNFEKYEDSDNITEVVIEENLLRMVAKLAGDKDEELSGLIGGLKLIKVYSFEVDKNNETDIKKRIKNVDKKLMDQDWDRIVRVKQKDEITNIYIKTANDNKVLGLVVASLEKDGEATFVNIVGNINLETIGRLSEKFNIPELEKVSGDEKDDEGGDEK
ncbi:MAG: DUF4252 domain-containing protein [Chlorobi bacterium]|nr:DUF4252 domain-containing protein [Chlorobiota bacterium]